MLWYGLQKYLSWIPLLLLLTILGYLLWNGSVEKVASLVVSYVFIWTVLLGLVEHFWTNAEFCAQAGWMIINGILISAIRHKGIGKTFTALNLLKTFGIAFFSTAFLCDFFMDMIYGNAIQNYVFLSHHNKDRIPVIFSKGRCRQYSPEILQCGPRHSRQIQGQFPGNKRSPHHPHQRDQRHGQQ